LKRIEPVLDRKALAKCDFVVEAAFERFEVKQEIFRELDQICRPGWCCLPTRRRSRLPKIAAQTKRPDKVIGMHFFNPVPLMKLVEVIRGIATSDETYAATKELAVKLEKTPVEVNDAPDLFPTAC